MEPETQPWGRGAGRRRQTQGVRGLRCEPRVRPGGGAGGPEERGCRERAPTSDHGSPEGRGQQAGTNRMSEIC